MLDLPPNIPPHAETVMLFDASKPATDKRFTVVDLRGKEPVVILRTTVAHGAGSDPNADGVIDQFSNTPNSLATSLGLYKVGEGYVGKNGLSYRLDGLDPTNSNARSRAVVSHPSLYVNNYRAGRSQGCPALSREAFNELQDQGVFNTSAYLVIYTSSKLKTKAFRRNQPEANSPYINKESRQCTQQMNTTFAAAQPETWNSANWQYPKVAMSMPEPWRETTPSIWPAPSDIPTLFQSSYSSAPTPTT